MIVEAADRHAHIQRLVSVVKMATVLECTIEEQRSVALFVGKMTQRKEYNEELFPVYGRKCLSRKAVPHLWKTFR
jgi:hypothetical protein